MDIYDYQGGILEVFTLTYFWLTCWLKKVFVNFQPSIDHVLPEDQKFQNPPLFSSPIILPFGLISNAEKNTYPISLLSFLPFFY